MKTYLDMDEVLRHCRRYIGQEYNEPYLVSAVPEEVIRSLSPADVVEVRHGHWTNERWEGLSSFSAECSECTKRTLSYFQYNYCPNCGAKMEEGRTMYEESERTCSTCTSKYCRYTNEVAEGKAQYNYKLMLDCLKHGHFFWKKYAEPSKEKT